MIFEMTNNKRERYPSVFLPEYITCDILIRLPVKALGRFRLVSKSWQKLITSSYFTHMHLDRSLQDEDNYKVIGVRENPFSQDAHFRLIKPTQHPSVDILKCHFTSFKPYRSGIVSILGSCNGIICLGFGGSSVLGLLNPVTREYKELPSLTEKPVSWSSTNRSFKSYGFGYNTVSQDYVVIRFTRFAKTEHGPLCETEVQAYSLSTNSWEKLQSFPYEVDPPGLSNKTHFFRSGVFASGALHWIAIPTDERENKDELIIAFDIANKQVREIQPPPGSTGKRPRWSACKFEITELNRNLCCVHYDTVAIDIWRIGCYSSKDPWSFMFRIENWGEYYLPIPIRIINSDVLLLCSGSQVYLYNRVGKHHSYVNPGDGNHVYGAVTIFVESLVALNFDGQPLQQKGDL